MLSWLVPCIHKNKKERKLLDSFTQSSSNYNKHVKGG